ncbi:hypothetical protein GF336_05420 [Candidatus Woesearchaeota archaeon]|nr:hypothetical protein [Candidatus Woesearchaeota archaeon]
MVKIERILQTVASLLAIIFPLSIFFTSSPQTTSIVCVITLGLLLIIFTFLFLFTEFRYSMKARYAEALSYIHMAQHIMRDISYTLLYYDNLPMKVIKGMFTEVLTNISNAFSLIKGVDCRVSLKLIKVDPNIREDLDDKERVRYYYVRTFTRDIKSKIKCQQLDQHSDVNHTIAGNTDFRELFFMEKGAERYWICGNIFKKQGYQNTRFEEGKTVEYHSVIVFPIRKDTTSETNKEHMTCSQDIHGFLCIDSKSRNIFNRRYDPELGGAIADALYSVLCAFDMADFEEIDRSEKQLPTGKESDV